MPYPGTWPKHDDGTLKHVADMTDAEFDNVDPTALALDFYEALQCE